MFALLSFVLAVLTLPFKSKSLKQKMRLCVPKTSSGLSSCLDRRELLWINVTANPTAEWIARQLTEAFPWDDAPQYLIRDRDRIYGTIVTRRLRSMGIRDKPIAPASPWAEWLRRTADRFDPARVRRPSHRLKRGPSAAKSCGPMLAITTTSEPTGLWLKVHRFLGPFSRPEASGQMPSSAGCITTTSESRFSVHTGLFP